MLTIERLKDMLSIRVDVPRLDAAVAEEFRSQMTEIVESGERHLLLDLDRVEHIDSAGLGAVAGLLKQVGRAGTVELTGVKGPVLKVFKLTRMSRLMTINEAA